MTRPSTTIRVGTGQRDTLRALAKQRGASMVDTLDAALDALKRELFYTQMAEAEHRLRSRPAEWDEFTAEREQWLDAPLDAQ